MAMTYQTRDGDMVDLICFDQYGAEALDQSVVAVLEANRGLADYGPQLPAGLTLILPDWQVEARDTGEQLWD